MTDRNHQWMLRRRPVGMVADDDFELVETDAPVPADGQFLVRNRLLSMEPAMRGWIADEPNYLPPVAIGAVMRSMTQGEVVTSRNPGFAPGDLVVGMHGWQEWALGDALARKLRPGTEPELALSALGMTGMTAYVGLLDIGSAGAGDVVVVSGAAGATGSVAGQIAKHIGCRVVGIAGGPRKCAWLTEEAHFDAAIDYKHEDVGKRLAELCPDGVDVFFDNVGGAILDEVLLHLALHARVVVCGAIVRFGTDELPPGPKHYWHLIQKRARMEGFVVIDHLGRADEIADDLAEWIRDGSISWKVDVQEGFERAPEVLRRVYTGENFGKQLLRI